MKSAKMLLTSVAVMLVLLFSLPSVFADRETETPVTPKTESAALFKNGFTVIRQSAEIPSPGIYCWENVPAAVHGTFFIESDLNVAVRSAVRAVAVDEKTPTFAAPKLTGQSVRVLVKAGGQTVTFEGTLLQNTAETEPAVHPLLTTPHHAGYYEPYRVSAAPTPSPQNSSEVMLKQTDGKIVCLNRSEIISVITLEPVKKEQTEKKPVVFFNVTEKAGKKSGTVRLTYLTKGASWAPSYRVRLLDGKKLQIEQNAFIRNEWMPLRDSELLLVSGFPQIEMRNTFSLLHPQQKLDVFFQQLMTPNRENDASAMSNNDILSNNGFLSNSRGITTQSRGAYDDIFDAAVVAAGDGPDIHYNNIGKQTLDTGDTLFLTTGQGKTDYTRILSCAWSVLSAGRNLYETKDSYAQLTPEVFDVIKFDNPLPFPMTTAPVLILEQEKFLGQSKTNWVNPKQQTSVNITKVMNVAVSYTESVDLKKFRGNSAVPAANFAANRETETKLQTERFNSNTYTNFPVTGIVEIVNRRNEPVTLHLSGTIIAAPDEANLTADTEFKKKSILPNVQAYHPNVCFSLYWELEIPAGEKKTITVTGRRWIRQ
ncbi:MAG: hypothetical protein LBH00_05035 [Planctomycetaceae bacterium]|nr:hypothetical protein [Planctomycetaceae bacterium]